MNQFFDLDPFNHGTTTVSYKEMQEGEYSLLAKGLKEGWGITGTKYFRLCTGAEVNSNNFRVESQEGTYLLKFTSNGKPKSHELTSKCILYLRTHGIKTPGFVQTRDGSDFYEFPSLGIFRLYSFIEGENFDGSQSELLAIASEIGKLHRSFAAMPYAGCINELRGVVVNHDRDLLEMAIKRARIHGTQSDFDAYVLGIAGELDQYSRQILNTNISALPFHVVHNDLHPHNVLFDNSSGSLEALLDFDHMSHSQRARDVGYAMHRLSRTCGENTERKNDCGVDVRVRAKQFLEAYSRENGLMDGEISALPTIIQDEAMRKIAIFLGDHYLAGNQNWSFDVPKQVTTLREARFFYF